MFKLLLLPRSITMAGIGAGVVSTLATQKYGRHLAVEVLKVGYEMKDGAESLMAEAKGLAAEARSEAKGKKAASK